MTCKKDVILSIIQKSIQGTACEEQKVSLILYVLHGACAESLEINAIAEFVAACGKQVSLDDGVTQKAAYEIVGILVARALGVIKTLAVIQLPAHIAHCRKLS